MNEPAADPRPSFPRLRRLDAAWYTAEKVLCGGMFLLMTLIVFMAVVRDVFGARHSYVDVLVTWVIMLGAMFTRHHKPDEKPRGPLYKVIVATVLTAVLGGLVELYVTLLPEGLLWANKAALCLMVWVGFLGASIATYEKAHLALEVGEKIWPKSARHIVKAIAHGLTSAFCVVLLVLSIESLAAHYASSAAAEGADTIPTLPWLPQWVVFLIFPYTFLAMAVRFLAQLVTTATRTDVTPEAGPT